MKKIFYILIAAVSVMFVACQKDPIGGSAVQSMSGEWYVAVDLIEPNSNDTMGEDILDGHIILQTFNGNQNDSNKLYLCDQGGFWDFMLLVSCDQNSKTFGDGPDVEIVNESYGDGEVKSKVWGGKIVPGGAVTPSGNKADAIEFFINFNDDEPEYGYAYRVYGWRYTGLVNDEDVVPPIKY